MAESVEARLARLEEELGELRDKEAIREVIHRYCQAVDRCDLEMLKSCYHEDGYDDHGFFAGNAHEFAEYVIPCLEQVDSSMHSITNTRFRFDGDRCATTSQWHVVHRLRHEEGIHRLSASGALPGRLGEADGEWKILHRVIAGDFDRWVHTLDLGAQTEGSPNQVLRGRRGPDDPGNLWFDLLNHKPDRPAMDDLWGMYHRLSEATRSA